MQMLIPKGRANYEPNSIDPGGPREAPAGLQTAPIPVEGAKVRLRSLTFELSKVDIREIR